MFLLHYKPTRLWNWNWFWLKAVGYRSVNLFTTALLFMFILVGIITQTIIKSIRMITYSLSTSTRITVILCNAIILLMYCNDYLTLPLACTVLWLIYTMQWKSLPFCKALWYYLWTASIECPLLGIIIVTKWLLLILSKLNFMIITPDDLICQDMLMHSTPYQSEENDY